MKKRENGFGVVEIILVVVGLCLVAFIAVTVINAQAPETEPTDSTIIQEKDAESTKEEGATTPAANE